MHPTGTFVEGGEHVGRHHQISFMCDDIEATRADLEARGATFSSAVTDRGFGLTIMLDVPGADPIMVYQPKHPTAYDR